MNEQILNILKTMPANELNNILNRELLRGLCFSRFGINTIYDLYEFNDFNNLTPAKKYKFERLHNILHNENDSTIPLSVLNSAISSVAFLNQVYFLP